jgi:hypothetical protein
LSLFRSDYQRLEGVEKLFALGRILDLLDQTLEI